MLEILILSFNYRTEYRNGPILTVQSSNSGITNITLSPGHAGHKSRSSNRNEPQDDVSLGVFQ